MTPASKRFFSSDGIANNKNIFFVIEFILRRQIDSPQHLNTFKIKIHVH